MNEISSSPNRSSFNNPDLKFLSHLKSVQHNNAYLVGGTVRDILIGREPVDIDIVITGDAEAFSKMLAREINGVLFSLDKRRGVFRVVSKEGRVSLHYDISPIRGGTIFNDLSLRDFTVDAIAIPVSDLNTIIDPFNGEGDIKRRCIRVVAEKSFDDDPLRLIRAFRLSSALGFEIEETTLNAIKSRSELLKLPARERIRDELFKILSSRGSSKYLYQIKDAGLLNELFPGLSGGNGEALSLGLAILERLEQLYISLEELFPNSYHDIKKYLNIRIEEGVQNAALLKWLSFYIINNVNGALMQNAVKALMLGNKASKLALLGVTHGNKLILDRNINKEDINNRRELYKFFKVMGEDGIGLILYQIASLTQSGEAPNLSVKNANESFLWYLHEYSWIRKNRIISGDDIKEILQLTPGPAIKELLDIIEENRVTGLLSTKEDVYAFLKKLATRR